MTQERSRVDHSFVSVSFISGSFLIDRACRLCLAVYRLDAKQLRERRDLKDRTK